MALFVDFFGRNVIMRPRFQKIRTDIKTLAE